MKPTSTHAQKIALHRLDIAIPCTASWDAMQGNDRVRHCGDCNKNVFNLSAMPEDEAAALVAGNSDGRLCVRFYRRQDGTVMTSDCGAKVAPAPAERAWGKLPGMAGMALAALSATGCAPSPSPHLKENVENVVAVDIKQEKQPAMTLVEPVMMMGAPPAPQAEVAPTPVAPAPVLEANVTMGKPMAPLLSTPQPEVDPAE